MKIVIGSQNPVKVNAVKIAFKKVFPNGKFIYESISVLSQVPDQPFGDLETLIGAENRARNSQIKIPEAEYWIGIEGGIESIEDGMKKPEMRSFAWVVTYSKNKCGKGKTGTFYLPNKVVNLINEGIELGDANDIVFGKHNSKQDNGAIGLLTHDIITRTNFYVDAVVISLIPFLNPELYK